MVWFTGYLMIWFLLNLSISNTLHTQHQSSAPLNVLPRTQAGGLGLGAFALALFPCLHLPLSPFLLVTAVGVQMHKRERPGLSGFPLFSQPSGWQLMPCPAPAHISQQRVSAHGPSVLKIAPPIPPSLDLKDLNSMLPSGFKDWVHHLSYWCLLHQ